MAAAATLAFTTQEAQRLTGLTPRRLQYWDETGFITPSIAARQGRGSPRLYSFRDLVQLRIAAQLRDQLSLQALRRLKHAFDIDAPFASVRFGISPGGETAYLGPTGAAEAVRTPGQIIVTFDLPREEIRADLTRRIGEIRTRDHVGEVTRTRGVAGGKPVLRGTRITPESVVAMLDDGWDRDRILAEFPDLVGDDIDAAIAWLQRAKHPVQLRGASGSAR